MSGRREQNGTGSLFERLSSRSSGTGMHTLRESIMHNLNNVLNTRPGNCRSAPDMGIADPGSGEQLSGNFYLAQIERIKACIERYEPRIAQVDVTAGTQDKDRPLDICFQISAFVDISGRRNVLKFNVRLDGCQHYRME